MWDRKICGALFDRIVSITLLRVTLGKIQNMLNYFCMRIAHERSPCERTYRCKHPAANISVVDESGAPPFIRIFIIAADFVYLYK